MSSEGSWRNLELRVAQFFQRNGYTARTNHKEQGRSGLIHEVDVLAERRDAAGMHRVAVECKAWGSPIEKDVVYKLEKVVEDTAITKGIIVSLGGLRSGARTAAERANIEVWGRDEIRHYLGDEALAGSPLEVPDEAVGVLVAVTRQAAEKEIRKARGGFAGIGTEAVASIDLLWVPAFEFQLAITRLRPGVLKDREEVVRRWALFEALTGRLIGSRDEPRAFTTVAMSAATLRRQKAPPQIVSDVKRIVAKHRNARSEAAQKTRQIAYNAVGLPGSTREFAVESEKEVFVSYYVGLLRRKGSERFVAVHAGAGSRTEAVEHALHERIDVVRQAQEEFTAKRARRMETAAEPMVGPLDRPPPPNLSAGRAPCQCGAEMVLRHRKSDGEAFWGCSTFPRCRHTRPAG